MSDIQIHLDEDNELRFGVAVEGAETGEVTCRMVLESRDSSMGIIFPGRAASNGEVKVLVPSLKSFLNEGVYPMKLEVLVDDRVFTPLTMDVELKQSVKVTAEAKVYRKKKGTTVTASVISEKKEEKAPIVETKQRRVNKNIMKQRQLRESRKPARQASTRPEDKELRNMLLDLFKKDV